MSKRRRGYPSEQQVKSGERIVRGVKELIEKLGRNDPCPCGSGRRFQDLLHEERAIRRQQPRGVLSSRAGTADETSARWRHDAL